MANKATRQNISQAKVLETVRIVRFALATNVIGDAEPVFAALAHGQPKAHSEKPA